MTFNMDVKAQLLTGLPSGSRITSANAGTLLEPEYSYTLSRTAFSTDYATQGFHWLYEEWSFASVMRSQFEDTMLDAEYERMMTAVLTLPALVPASVSGSFDYAGASLLGDSSSAEGDNYAGVYFTFTTKRRTPIGR